MKDFRKSGYVLCFLLLWILLIASFAFAGDPSGEATGAAADIAERLEISERLADEIGKSRVAINMVWTLIAGFLVMFMAAGFALLETGFIRAKNAAHTMGMNLIIYAAGMIGFWICGFAFMFGGFGDLATFGGTETLGNELTINLFGKSFGLIGYKGFFLSGGNYDVAIFTLFLFQMVFMVTAGTIPSGAAAERLKFLPFVFHAFFISMIAYPIFGNWVWGGGWLSQLGYIDFAGSSVVHMAGGVTGLVLTMLLGPRIGKYNADGSPNPIPGHNIPMAILGTLILAFGWFGFNPGSTLAGSDLRISVIATNTLLASGAGTIAAMIYMWLRLGKPDPSMMANGMLAGLVAITASCAYVNSISAVVIGLIAGVLVCWSVFFLERKGVDDPVGAVSVHGTCGAWGILTVGLFADGTYGVTGLLYGNGGQLAAQFIGVVTNIVFFVVMSYIFFKVLDLIIGLRVSREVEIQGLDIPEMGVQAYTTEEAS